MLSKAFALHLASLDLVRYDETGPTGAPPCYVETMPDGASTPDYAVCVYSRNGFPSRDLSGYETPELQVVYRTAANAGHQAGYDGAEAIRRVLNRTANVAWAAGTPHEQYVLTCDTNEPEPVYLGPDAAGRPRWSLSVQTELTKEVT